MVARTLLGRRSDGSYGLDISKAGYDVTSTGASNMAFTTNYAHAALIHQSGIVSSFDSSGRATVGFPTLSYVPHAEVGFVENSTGKYMGPFTSAPIFSFPGCFLSTNSIIVYTGGVSPATYSVKYWVYKIPGGS